jgi:hypothetical protein
MRDLVTLTDVAVVRDCASALLDFCTEPRSVLHNVRNTFTTGCTEQTDITVQAVLAIKL